ncbi:MAG: DUF5663 domain-containing protein [Candidatus Moraniibacteriota bacterium]|nr:MAG: hypothetical protein IPJ68_04745 [Candidatus Moranbacteria bacterium]
MDIDYSKIEAELIESLALAGLPKPKQEELLAKMLEALLKRIFMETMERLGEQGMTDYEALIETAPSEAAVGKFLDERIPEYSAFVQNIVDQFKKDIKATA